MSEKYVPPSRRRQMESGPPSMAGSGGRYDNMRSGSRNDNRSNGGGGAPPVMNSRWSSNDSNSNNNNNNNNGGNMNRQDSFDNFGRRGDRDNRDGYNNRGGNYNDRGGNYDGSGSSSSSYNNNSYGDRGNYRGDRGGGGHHRERRDNYSSSSAATKNAMGFHGDLNPDPFTEQFLFDSSKKHSTGINFDKYDEIKVETSDGCPDPCHEFNNSDMGDAVMKNLASLNFLRPTPVQQYSIPIGLGGHDMMACAQTGSGKTAGYLFPLIAVMLRDGPRPEPVYVNKKVCYITALILAPTRELANQIYGEAKKFCYCTGIRPAVVYGGVSIKDQIKDLQNGCDLLVATPGRLDDMRGSSISLESVKFLVLDEADRMLDMGFEPQIRSIVMEENGGKRMPRDRQTFMFSATFPVEIQCLAKDFMKDYIFVTIGRVGSASKDVTQRIDEVHPNDKYDYLLDHLNKSEGGLVLVFVEKKRSADIIERKLSADNFPAVSIHGDKSQQERENALHLFKTERRPILVATDVAARGLDIPNVTQVINYDLPSNIDDYVHRIGRTGRAGHTGLALSMYTDKNRNIAHELGKLLVENGQECPPFLGSRGGGRWGNSGGGYGDRGGRQFRDARSQNDRVPQTVFNSRSAALQPNHGSSNKNSNTTTQKAPASKPAPAPVATPAPIVHDDDEDDVAW